MPRKENIRRMFDSISGDYDKLNHIMSASVDKSWRRRALKYVVSPGSTQGGLAVLDVACGTGDFSIAIARKMEKAGVSGLVTGVDLSEGMLNVMRSKVEEAGLGERISALKGDGEELGFADGSFDRVTIAFGIRNFENRQKGLGEFFRVLKPGGRLVILELSLPGNPVLRWLYNLYFLKILPSVGALISGERAAYEYLPASVLKFPRPGEFLKSVEKAGFSKVFSKSYTLGICRLFVGEKA